MGYFSNGTEGMQYEAKYCDQCVHNHAEHGCPVWMMQMEHNYSECNNKDSLLHKMIPRLESGFSGECVYFVTGPLADPAADAELVKYKAAMAEKMA